jgi:hypothetical protein
MTSTLLLLALASLLTFDVCFTTRRITKLGPDVELNPIVRYLVKKLGPFNGSTIGILLPNTLLYSLLFAFHCDIAMGYFLGVRSLLTVLQLKSHE